MGEIRPSGQILQRPCLLGPESCPAHCRPEGQALLRCLSPRRNPEITSLTVGLRRLRAFALTSQEAPAEAMLLPQCTRSTPPRCTRTLGRALSRWLRKEGCQYCGELGVFLRSCLVLAERNKAPPPPALPSAGKAGSLGCVH